MTRSRKTSPSVVLIRHAETEWSRIGRHTGTTDLPITEAGRRSLGELRIRLGSHRFGLVLVSPLLRARQTCEVLGFSDEAQVRDGLAEWRYGRFEGLTPAEIQDRSPGWDLWDDGAPDGESPLDVTSRIDRVIEEIQASVDRVEDILVVAHGHSLRAFGARWMGLPVWAGRHLRLGTGTVSTLGWHHGERVVRRWNVD